MALLCDFSHVDHSRVMPHIFSRSLGWQCLGAARTDSRSPGSWFPTNWGILGHGGARGKGHMVVMLDACLEHQGASLEQMCSPVWKGELCYIPCKGRGERGKAERFSISLLPSPPQNPKALEHMETWPAFPSS